MSVPANWFDTYDVVASPTGAAETVIAILTGVGPLLPDLAVHLSATVNASPDADATSVVLSVRRDSLTGEQVSGQGFETDFAPGAVPEGVFSIDVVDFPGDFAGATYVLTLQCAAAASESVVDGLGFHARVS